MIMWVGLKKKKKIKILCLRWVNIQGGIGYNLSGYDSFLHTQSIFSVVIILFSFKDDRGEPVCKQSTLATYSNVTV